ncbi:MAG: hypothetical protein ACM3SU_01650 [Acidobacteriota bacterium]
MSAKAAAEFPDSFYGRASHFTCGGASCPARAGKDDGDRMVARLVRAAYRDTGSAEIPGELLRRILSLREDMMSGLVSVLAGLAVSPLLVLTVGR